MGRKDSLQEPLTTVGDALGLPEGIRLSDLSEQLDRIRAVSADVADRVRGATGGRSARRGRGGESARIDNRIAQLREDAQANQDFFNELSAYFELLASGGDVAFLKVLFQRLKGKCNALDRQRDDLRTALGRWHGSDPDYQLLTDQLNEINRLIVDAVSALTGLDESTLEARMSTIDRGLQSSERFSGVRERLTDSAYDMDDLFRSAASLQTRDANDGRTPLGRVLVYIERLNDRKLKDPKYRPTAERVDKALSDLVALVTEQFPIATFQEGHDRQPPQFHLHATALKIREALGDKIDLGIVGRTFDRARYGLDIANRLGFDAGYHSFIEKYERPGGLPAGHSLVLLQERVTRPDSSMYLRTIGAKVTRGDGGNLSFRLKGRRTRDDVVALAKHGRLEQKTIRKAPAAPAGGSGGSQAPKPE